ncbi:MAG: ATP-binding protein, partial [Pseudomonadales bacterium]
ELAGDLLRSGEHVIVDATFLDRDRRQPFVALAAALGSPAVVLHCHAPLDVLRQRVADRSKRAGAPHADPSDADLAVLEHQLARFEPPTTGAIGVDTRDEPSYDQLLELQRRLLDAD